MRLVILEVYLCQQFDLLHVLCNDSVCPRCKSCNEHRFVIACGVDNAVHVLHLFFYIRKSLFALVSKGLHHRSSSTPFVFTNHRHLTTPEKVDRLQDNAKESTTTSESY